MRIQKYTKQRSKYKILVVGDEKSIVNKLTDYLNEYDYTIESTSDPLNAIEIVKDKTYNLLILDYIMADITGDKVVEKIRKFNKEIYIILISGKNNENPPIEIIRSLDIQGFCDKKNNLNQLSVLVESALKSIYQMDLIKQMNSELQKTYDKLENSYIDTIQMLRSTVEAKDIYTKGHSDRVSEISVVIGEKLGLSDEDIDTLRIGGLFHDIGKIGVADTILTKNGKLTDDEYLNIKKHPIIGANILESSNIFEEIIPIVKFHHEKYDGSGYPCNLKGEKIPYLARITAIADTYDAMASKRPYRKALSKNIIKQEFEKNLGIQFDPNIGKIFLDILENDYDIILEIQNKY